MWSSSSSGGTSGSGLAIANTIASGAILLTASTETPPGLAAADVPPARLHQELADRDAGGADPDEHDAQVLHRLSDHLRGVQEPGEDDDGRAVLVVVEDGDVELLTQPALDLEAARGGDV